MVPFHHKTSGLSPYVFSTTVMRSANDIENRITVKIPAIPKHGVPESA
jgi:hypothetical protein